mmetsp:Transcript_25483/g.24368  ORF Transcript_25483/g.24368 Transcript_25483/m.24368 type:complete len:1128 (+) Transcript_25483:151-3534(+)|eukprot:CAMPEP_0119045500 /NCGR_PEP_ID=MMETSP1177-20130426/40443_1 /TAXON_ID=2985 /ORGANISM="Ochromonas sp, Strain CCMP1899" /LENGTH=1127 /DNA_ID=CAMNT_0007017415 /DNA_START=72 /DNA_END=3455 /DNA_ORIENTATION=-
MEKINLSMVEIAFKVNGKIRLGEEIRISGDAQALGNGDRERAIPMFTSPNDYPWWRTKEALFLPGRTISYRYSIFSGGKFNRWEGNGNMHRQLVPEVGDNKNRANYERRISDILGDLSSGAELINCNVNRTKISSTETSIRSKQFAEWGRKCSIDSSLNATDGVIIVSYFLPVNLTRSSSGEWSASWDKENLLSLTLDARATYVGSVRYHNAPIHMDEEENVTIALLNMNCHPIFIDQKTHYHFYDIFCKQSLWLLLHHVNNIYSPLKQADIGAKGQQDLWFTYSTVNRIFRDKVVEVFQAGNLVWVHGFHLMLLPSFLRRFLHFAKIGYFFHTPFPSSEIWKTLTRNEDLLRGILAADQIGFHLYEYARHFLTNCHRILGYKSETNAAGILSIHVDGREVAVTCIHVGVDMPYIQQAFVSKIFESDMHNWRKKFLGKTVVAGIGRLERLQGLPLKLLAIERFLREEPYWRDKLIFSMIGITALERGEDYRQTQHDVKVHVRRINEIYGNGGLVVHCEERSEKDFRLPQRLAFFASSDILMITSTRDGLNRLPMEFTLARHHSGNLCSNGHAQTEGSGLPNQGVAIISEFISSARVMRGALIVNPWKVEEVKNALKLALEMSPSDRIDRMRRNLEFSSRLTTQNWAKEVLKDLKSVEKCNDAFESYSVGFGMGFRIMGVKAGFHTLDMTAVTKAYRGARHRLVLLDWGGTLVAESDKVDKLAAYSVAKGIASRVGPTIELKKTLEALCSDEKNVVFVLSGKELYAVSEFFGDVRGLGLGAEHGFYYRWPMARTLSSKESPEKETSPCSSKECSSKERIEISDDKSSLLDPASPPLLSSPRTTTAPPSPNTPKQQQWETIQAVGDQTWKLAAKVIMEMYVQRTHGTYIEQKGNELIWQFRDADPEFGFQQSKELEQYLREIMSVYNVEVSRGGGVSDGYIEARPKGVSKGLFLNHAIAIMKDTDQAPDFIMAVGDDISDEPMFEHLDNISDIPPSSVFSVTVGKKPSYAHSYVDDPAALMDILSTLVKSSKRDTFTKHPSTGTLLSLSSSFLTAESYSPFPLGPDSPPARSLGLGLYAADVESSLDTKMDNITAHGALTPGSAHQCVSQYLDSIDEYEEIEDDSSIYI